MTRTTACLLTLLSGCLAADDELGTIEQDISGPRAIIVETPYDGTPTKQLEIACPGLRVASHLGAVGVDQVSPFPDVAITSRPSLDGRSWRVYATYYGGGAVWKLRGTLLCITRPAGYEVVVGSTAVATTQPVPLQLDCPAGKVVLGAAGITVADLGVAAGPRHDAFESPIEGRLTYSMPSVVSKSNVGRSWLMHARAFGIGGWSLQGAITCADRAGLDRYKIVLATKSVSVPSPSTPNIASCGSWSSVGGGWAALDDAGAILEGATYADGWVQNDGWASYVRRVDGVAGPWKQREAVICN